MNKNKKFGEIKLSLQRFNIAYTNILPKNEDTDNFPTKTEDGINNVFN